MENQEMDQSAISILAMKDSEGLAKKSFRETVTGVVDSSLQGFLFLS